MSILTAISILAGAGVLFLFAGVAALLWEAWTRIRPDLPPFESVDDAARTGTWKADF